MANYLREWGYELILAENGDEAWEVIRSDSSLRMAILDWQMPGVDGTEICHRVREELHLVPFYLMLLTARGGKENLLKGLQAGADDFVIKPFDKDILQARVEVGVRSVEMQSRLVGRIMELDAGLSRALEFRRALPICGQCKRIRGTDEAWHEIPRLAEHDLEGDFNQQVCPECAGKSKPA